MRYLVTGAEMKRYDQNCMEKIGIPSLVLMERAALETFYVLREKGWILAGESALILAGVGNNGGDGLALARLLCEAGMTVKVFVVGNIEKASKQWSEQREILKHYPVEFLGNLNEDNFSIVVDAIFGVGLSRQVSGEFDAAIRRGNELKGYKVSLDIPSGVSSDDGKLFGISFQADVTVTYGFEKRGLYLYPGCKAAGEVRLADVGITKYAFFDEEPTCFTLDETLEELLPKRSPDGNKGSFGKALILAGSKNMAGAAILCARACYRLGAGMVKILSSSENRVILQESLPEAMLGPVEDAEEIKRSLAWCDVVCIGPGIGKSEEAKNAFKRVLEDLDGVNKPLVIDADGINMVAEDPVLCQNLRGNTAAGRIVLMTPHPGELLKLTKSIFPEEKDLTMDGLKNAFAEKARRVAEELGVILVAKDARTICVNNNCPIYMNLSGNSGMGTAGSGDVLSGIITAFFCQENKSGACEEKDYFLAACRAVRTHGLLGDLEAKRGILGEHSVMAGDLYRSI